MNLAQKFDSISCRQDEKARRVLNVAPDTVATITAEELEAGVTLERLEALNVPVLRYNTQVTIHGKIPSFSGAARPGGYKSLFQNSNGSVGVRYAAVDAPKKEILNRAIAAVRSAGGAWSSGITSAGLEIYRSFIVKDESVREEQKQATIAAGKSIPVHRFYGCVNLGVLPFGAGYGVCVSVGAIPEAELWALVDFFSGLKTAEEVDKACAERERERDEYFAKLAADNEARAATRRAEVEEKRAALKLVKLAEEPDTGVIFVDGPQGLLEIRLETIRGRRYSTVLACNFQERYDRKRSLMKNGFSWPKALAEGRVYRRTDPEIAA